MSVRSGAGLGFDSKGREEERLAVEEDGMGREDGGDSVRQGGEKMGMVQLQAVLSYIRYVSMSAHAEKLCSARGLRGD